MALPTVVIVGRPNVGKSTLFNAIAGERIAIVDPTAGVTRDRVSAPVELEHRWIELVDTGGIGVADAKELEQDIQNQIQVAIDEADAILFVVDAKAGMVAGDQEIARRLRRLECPVMVVANKVEADGHQLEASVFYRLGFGEVREVSAKSRTGIHDLEDQIEEWLPEGDSQPDEGGLKIAIVGRMNAGKSTLVNYLVGEERVIVSGRPGTTRDAIDVPFERDGHRYVAVDTAGIRKLRVVSGTPDFYAQDRAERAIKRCDVVLFLIDANRQIGSVDRRIADSILEAGRPCVITLTKWDEVENSDLEAFEKYVADRIPALSFAPISVISSFDELNIDGTLKLARDLYDQASMRATTGQLNRVLQRAITEHAPRAPRGRGGKVPKIFYATQADICPPTMVVFVNEPGLFSDNFLRFLSHRFREMGPFTEIPVKVFLKARHPKN